MGPGRPHLPARGSVGNQSPGLSGVGARPLVCSAMQVCSEGHTVPFICPAPGTRDPLDDPHPGWLLSCQVVLSILENIPEGEEWVGAIHLIEARKDESVGKGVKRGACASQVSTRLRLSKRLGRGNASWLLSLLAPHCPVGKELRASLRSLHGLLQPF